MTRCLESDWDEGQVIPNRFAQGGGTRLAKSPPNLFQETSLVEKRMFVGIFSWTTFELLLADGRKVPVCIFLDSRTQLRDNELA
jgi:hypothetical protein